MKILVTGYSGSIGTLICNKLSKSHEIIKINCRNIDFENNTEKQNLLKNFLNIDVVINCAANLKPKNRNDFYINEELPKLISNYLETNNQKCLFFHLSTINVLIKLRKDSYTISKKKAEEKLKNTKTIILRLPLIFKENNSQIDNFGNLSIFFKYLNFNLPIYPMIYPGHCYEPLNINKFLIFLEQLIYNKGNDELIYNISGGKKKFLWNIFKEISDQKNKKIFKINISKYIPNFLLNFFSKNNNFSQQFVNIDNSKFEEKKYILE
jgi:nucleoside-diphosphate-sugar epimerase|tara:strand:- start:1336 stop:2133 length:798 start_codon:yes stop_codon:yes gene_type:complete